ncbi:glycerophosphodiester phosphodiesterase [Fusobacterium simiae]|uniref:Glycerophosphodiester phosphodiesterase n=1 Tax=Fusobacterium simiae TaxID=855 RepID=A0ABT4DG73_FUSSI|nr:glycerophosphodiester phosphodiesterase [Fusobacterium simiae]MCY7007590.1 glycerophosphodiester phosphodiesterase [Fusobacterium simiae]
MKIFAHRGASGYAPENTLTAIKKAIEMKADGIEIDIQLTKDGKIVVMHDWKVDRTTTGRGYVYELDFKYIRSLDAGQWYTKDFIGEVVPTLEEVLDILPNDMILNIEIKDIARKHSNIEEKMLEVLKKYPEKFDNIIVSSFHHDKIRKLQELEPKLKLALLTDSEFIEIEKYLSTNGLNSYSYHPEINLISKETVEILHKNGVKVFVWSVNKEEDLDYLVKIGVDGVITNYPDIMKELLM